VEGNSTCSDESINGVLFGQGVVNPGTGSCESNIRRAKLHVCTYNQKATSHPQFYSLWLGWD